MAVPSQSQHRCVFVGNIPYDATEEQLIQICEEVGPVISFRLVIDRETGKPKGYGFCEYKDEETALSARRNLQGYEINGRQLRVDFAENDKDKTTDKSREQGRGGPGIVPTADPHKQVGAPALRDPSFLLPVGDSFAMTAATVMAGALGSSQTAVTSNQIGLQNLAQLGTDPLTRHLAKLSRSQLTEIMSEVKAMAIQDKEQARKLLLSIPNLPKALFQAQIILGMVPPQMLLMPNILQISAQPAQPVMQVSQTLPGLPPLPQNRMPYSVLPYAQEVQVPVGLPEPYAVAPQFPTPSQIQHPQVVQNQVFQQNQLSLQAGVTSIPSVRPTSSLMNQQVQTPLQQHPGQVLPNNPVYTGYRIAQDTSTQHSVLTRPQVSADRFQPPSLASSATLENRDVKGRDLNLTRKANDSLNQMKRAPKMVKLNNGSAAASSPQSNLAAPVFAASQPLVKKEAPTPEAQVTEMQLPSDVDSALLQQVLNLTPEQVNSLPPDQQQQVIQLQQILRQAA